MRLRRRRAAAISTVNPGLGLHFERGGPGAEKASASCMRIVRAAHRPPSSRLSSPSSGRSRRSASAIRRFTVAGELFQDRGNTFQRLVREVAENPRQPIARRHPIECGVQQRRQRADLGRRARIDDQNRIRRVRPSEGRIGGGASGGAARPRGRQSGPANHAPPRTLEASGCFGGQSGIRPGPRPRPPRPGRAGGRRAPRRIARAPRTARRIRTAWSSLQSLRRREAGPAHP